MKNIAIASIILFYSMSSFSSENLSILEKYQYIDENNSYFDVEDDELLYLKDGTESYFDIYRRFSITALDNLNDQGCLSPVGRKMLMNKLDTFYYEASKSTNCKPADVRRNAIVLNYLMLDVNNALNDYLCDIYTGEAQYWENKIRNHLQSVKHKVDETYRKFGFELY